MTFGFYTLGCKQNQYETQAMEQLLREQGHEIRSFEERCDCYVINTCTVTAVSDKKSRNMIRRARKIAPEAVIGVCGCYSQMAPKDIAALEVDVICGTGNRKKFLAHMLRAAEERQSRPRTAPAPVLDVTDAMTHRSFEELPAGGLPTRTRAMLKVEDGCCNFCAYCIIPYARGPVRSLPLEAALAQARRLAEEGYLELVVTGIEISSWGRDLQNEDGTHPLPEDLLEALCRAVPAMRVRLGSLEPRTVTEAFCRRLSGCPNLCPQFHLSLQSGSDTVLKRMRRRYDTARYRESVRLLREYFPGCAVTTDLIVAFPGETEAEFRESLDFIWDCGLAAVHVFPYSRRPGTVADKLPGQLSNAVKEQRSADACARAAECAERYRRSMIGSLQQVLFEQDEASCSTGHAPNSVLCYLPEPGLHNVVLTVRVKDLCDGGVLVERVDR